MGKWTLMLALCALVMAAVPQGIYLGTGLGMLAAYAGYRVYRWRQAPPWTRLAGAGSLALACIALLLAGGRFAATWWAVSHLGQVL